MVEGSCLCGNIRYEVELIPGKIFNCHCKFCRKAHGADYVTVALAKASTLKLTDDKGYLKEHKNNAGGKSIYPMSFRRLIYSASNVHTDPDSRYRLTATSPKCTDRPSAIKGANAAPNSQAKSEVSAAPV